MVVAGEWRLRFTFESFGDSQEDEENAGAEVAAVAEVEDAAMAKDSAASTGATPADMTDVAAIAPDVPQGSGDAAAVQAVGTTESSPPVSMHEGRPRDKRGCLRNYCDTKL